MTKKEPESEGSWRDMLRRDREAHERLLQRIGKHKPSGVEPVTPEMEQRPRETAPDSDGDRGSGS